MAAKIRRPSELAASLRAGQSASITRLTVLKSLCEDRRVANAFALHLAGSSYEDLLHRERPSGLDEAQWEQAQQAAREALEQMARYLREPTPEDQTRLRASLSTVKAFQDEHRDHRWGLVRTIWSTELLLVEYALSCLLQPHAAPDWCYRIGRCYAERYDPSFGTGLLPASAPMVEEIAAFLRQMHIAPPTPGS